MQRTTTIALTWFLVVVPGCRPEPTPTITPTDANSTAATAPTAPPPVDPTADPMNAAEAIRRLSDPKQDVRDAAAAILRATDPADSGDPGEAFWKKKLAAVSPGMTRTEVESLTGAKSEGGLSSGQTTTVQLRLDDYWMLVAYFNVSDELTELGPLSRRARAVWVDPDKNFSGRWVTYFVHGAVAHDIDYRGGTYVRFTSYYDNGQRAYEQRYVDGKVDGDEVGFHRGGEKAYEIHHAAGKSVGRWVHWYPNGKMQSEQSWVDGMRDGSSLNFREDGTLSSRIDYQAGKETGQAAWDERGKLLFARGTAKDAPATAAR